MPLAYGWRSADLISLKERLGQMLIHMHPYVSQSVGGNHGASFITQCRHGDETLFQVYFCSKYRYLADMLLGGGCTLEFLARGRQ